MENEWNSVHAKLRLFYEKEACGVKFSFSENIFIYDSIAGGAKVPGDILPAQLSCFMKMS